MFENFYEIAFSRITHMSPTTHKKNPKKPYIDIYIHTQSTIHIMNRHTQSTLNKRKKPQSLMESLYREHNSLAGCSILQSLTPGDNPSQQSWVNPNTWPCREQNSLKAKFCSLSFRMEEKKKRQKASLFVFLGHTFPTWLE